MKELTERQREIYLFILHYQENHGYSPSIRDICKGVFLSQPSVTRHIDNLIKLGYIEYTPKVARSIVIKNKTQAC